MTTNSEGGSAAVTDIFKYNQAIRRAKLSGPQKAALFALSSLANPRTGLIPDRFQPSYTELARHAGIGRSTLARVVLELEDEGWFKKSSPSVQEAWQNKETNHYLLTLPAWALALDGDEEDELVAEQGRSQSGTSPAEGLVPERDQSQSGTGLVPERDRTSPGAGHDLVTSLLLYKNTSSSAAPPTGEGQKDSPEPKSKPKRARKPEPYRDDVEKVCAHLAEWIVKNGSKQPTITEAWRREARLLIDEKRPDPVTVDKIIALIDWCQQDTFWRSNIQSMPKFREKYDALRLRALEDWNRKKAGGGRQPWRPDPTRSREERFARPTRPKN